MRVSWFSNIVFPEASILMKEEPVPYGGWLLGASAALAEQSSIELSIAFPKKDVEDIVALRGTRIRFYAFPSAGGNKGDGDVDKHLAKIVDLSCPDVVHIFGTEYPHSLKVVDACIARHVKVVISIQGLVSIYAKHYMAGLPSYVQNRFTLRDFLKQDNLRQQQGKFVKRGKSEIEALQKVKHIIGRTTWDRACSFQINPDAQYHHCKETLRDEFYRHTWDLTQCERHSIFVSQGSYPIKGLHFVLEAMPLILRRFPEARLYVGGDNITRAETLKDKLRTSSYGKYIKELIQKYDLQKHVVFTGLLDEQQMCARYLGSHVFVSASSIENSPNSLGEGMILGVPCVASNVGGVPDMLTHREEGFLYQADAPYMLAYYVCEIFVDDELALALSRRARERARRTHDREQNTKALIGIYKDVIAE